MANFLSTSDLDAATLKANFVTYLQSQDKFKDYDFTGSNMSVLLDVLIQNTMYNNHYLNMIGAESYLDSAQLRESIVSRAKELNYVPKSKSSARATVTVEVFPEDEPNNIVIPKGYKFKSIINNTTYYYATRQTYSITRKNEKYSISGVEIFEGESITEFFQVISEQVNNSTYYTSRQIISSKDVDINSLEVYVTLNGIKTRFTKADSLFGLSSTSNVFFIQGHKAYEYEIVFGDGVLGRSIPTGSQVEIQYTDTLGSAANGINTFSSTSAIDGYSSISVVTEIPSYGGSDTENDENIKFNAVRHFQVQERAVIEDDYRNLILTNFPEIQAVNAYGGEQEFLYGKVVVCLKPYNTTALSINLKNRIYNFLKKKNLTTEPVIRGLEYFYIRMDATIRYSPNNTIETESDIKSKVISALLALNESKFNKFNQSVYSSALTKIIDSADTSIISNSLFLKIIKRLSPQPNIEITHIIEFDNPLPAFGLSPKGNKEFPSNHPAMIESTIFTYTYNGTDYESWIQDNGSGQLGVYTYNSEGEKTMLKAIGTVDYNTGKCVFTLAIKGYNGYISLYAKPRSRDIIISKNKFIILDSSDFNIGMITDA